MNFAAAAAIIALSATPLAAQAAKFNASVYDASGKHVEDAIVYLSNGTSQNVAQPTKAIVDQIDKEFVPKVSVVQTGTAIEFPNSDNIRHQVYSFSPARTFTLKLYSGRPSAPVLFDKPGVVVLGCNIHDHMLAYILAVDTPWYRRVDSRGEAVLDNLPAGSYSISLWKPGLQTPVDAGKLQIGATESVTRTLRFDMASP